MPVTDCSRGGIRRHTRRQNYDPQYTLFQSALAASWGERVVTLGTGRALLSQNQANLVGDVELIREPPSVCGS
jgi:hypothetical protein